MTSLKTFFRGGEGQGGQAVLLMAITLMGMLMMVGLAIDAGQLYAARRTMQEAADAGAYAGAVVLYQQGTQPQARAAAVTDTTLNGYTDTVSGFTVTVNAPPASGAYAGNNRYVEVTLSGWVRTAIVPAQSVLNFISVRGVAGAEPLNNNYAIMALDRGNTNCAFSTSPNADVHLTGGGILVNSSSNTAACNSQSSGARFTIDPNPPNGIDINGRTSSSWPPGLDVEDRQPQQADPLSGFPPPTSGCNPALPNDPCTVYGVIPGGSPKILDPGIWTTSLSAGGGTEIYLRPGIYILKGNGLNASGNADVISMRTDTTPACAANCGVLIFNTHSNYPAAFRPGLDSCGGLSLVGNGASDLRALTTGTYANLVFYQDPACTNEMVIAGNGTFNGTGSIYLPNAPFRFNGNPSTLNGSQLVARTVDIQNGNITINFNPGNAAQPILPRLAE